MSCYVRCKQQMKLSSLVIAILRGMQAKSARLISKGAWYANFRVLVSCAFRAICAWILTAESSSSKISWKDLWCWTDDLNGSASCCNWSCVGLVECVPCTQLDWPLSHMMSRMENALIYFGFAGAYGLAPNQVTWTNRSTSIYQARDLYSFLCIFLRCVR